MLKEYSFDDIYIRHAIDDDPDDKEFTMHIHEKCEIYFFVSGDVEYLVEGSKYPLNDNSLMIMRPAESHKPRIAGGKRYERYAINFPISFASAVDPEGRLTKIFSDRSLGQNNMFTSSEIDMALVGSLFAQMCENSDDYDKQLTIKTHLLMLLDMISRAYSAKGSVQRTPKSVDERVVMYVNSHLSEDISVPSLAAHFYLSASQFSRVFKQATGAAPWEYITKKRLTAAKEMLREGDTARSAAEQCGFKDYSVFYRAYTKHFGHSPKDHIG